MPEEIREAIQRLLNASGDGWSVAQYVIAMGLERIAPNGEVESTVWYWAPGNQPEWQTAGLLDRASELHYLSDDIEDLE